jgi:hypothetical protein
LEREEEEDSFALEVEGGRKKERDSVAKPCKHEEDLEGTHPGTEEISDRCGSLAKCEEKSSEESRWYREAEASQEHLSAKEETG